MQILGMDISHAVGSLVDGVAMGVLLVVIAYVFGKYSHSVYMHGVKRGIRELESNLCKGSLFIDVMVTEDGVTKEIRFEYKKEHKEDV